MLFLVQVSFFYWAMTNVLIAIVIWLSSLMETSDSINLYGVKKWLVLLILHNNYH
jgi:hypothetical protein